MQLHRSLMTLFKIDRANARKGFLRLHPELKDARVDTLIEDVQRLRGGESPSCVIASPLFQGGAMKARRKSGRLAR
jgi:hypothetical protein